MEYKRHHQIVVGEVSTIECTTVAVPTLPPMAVAVVPPGGYGGSNPPCSQNGFFTLRSLI